MLLAEIIVYAAFVYLGIGFIFAIYFAFSGVKKLDESAKDAGIAFSLIIFFGVVAFWVLLGFRILRGEKRPIETNSHRKAVKGS